MKFISKSANLHIILRPGLQAQPLTGSPAVATISVRFQDGVANVEQENLVGMMMNHPGFNQDFIAADTTGTDPFAYMRQDSEPTHVMTEMKYGHPQGRNVSPVKTKLPPEVLRLVQEQATNIAKQMLPGMVETALKGILAASKKIEEEKDVSTGAMETGTQTVESPSVPTAVVKPKSHHKAK